MIQIEKEITTKTTEIIDIHDGTYYFKKVDYDEVDTYRKAVIAGDQCTQLIVVNEQDSRLSITSSINYFDIPWQLSSCFKGDKTASVISKQEFDEQYNVVLQSLTAILK